MRYRTRIFYVCCSYYIVVAPWIVNDNNWATILSLPRLNPHLEQLVLHAHCKHAQVVELLLSYLKISNESHCARSFSICHNLRLLGYGWSTVFGTLSRKHKCSVMRLGENVCRVRCPQLGQSHIQLVEQDEIL